MLKKWSSLLLSGALMSCAAFPSSHAVFLDPRDIPLDVKIGQMLCLDFRQWKDESGNPRNVTEINDTIREIIGKYHIGSVILFRENFSNEFQSKKLIADLQSAAISSGNPPLIIAVDQEGGSVERFAFDRKKLKDNAEITGPTEAYEKRKVICSELHDLGINCDFAPVVDVRSNPESPITEVRSFGADPEKVAVCGESFMRGLHENGVAAVAKHFPGHGCTELDTHVGLAVANKTLGGLEELELIPFDRLIKSGVDMVMTAHIALPYVTSEKAISIKDDSEIPVPATLSKGILTGVLRDKLGFRGVIVSDAMNMGAISEHFGERERVARAINAGVDMVLMPVTLRNKEDIEKLKGLIGYIKDLIISGGISEERINESVKRIFELKEKYC